MNKKEDLIDVHAHFVTPDYTAAAKAAGHVHADGMPGAWPVWSAEHKLDLMDRNSIRTAVLSVSTPGVHFGDDAAARELARNINEYAAHVVDLYQGRFLHFASLPLPDISGTLREISFAMDSLGAIGVTVYTNSHGIYLGDAEFDPIWHELDSRKAIVFIHPTSPPNWESVSPTRPRPIIEFPFETTRAVTDLLFAGSFAKYPNIRWIVPHNGGTLPFLADRINAIGQYTGTFSPENGSARELLKKLWFDTAGTPFPTQLPTLASVVGHEQLLYGSDSCWTPVSTVERVIASLDDAVPPNSARSWRALTTANAERLLPLLSQTAK